MDFVRKAVRSIGRLAVKIESSAERCIAALLELIQTKVNYVVQEAIVVIKVCLIAIQLLLGCFFMQHSLNSCDVTGHFPQIP